MLHMDEFRSVEEVGRESRWRLELNSGQSIELVQRISDWSVMFHDKKKSV